MGPFANSFPRWRLWPIQVLGEDRPTGMTADLEALVADWIGVTPGGNRADCGARRPPRARDRGCPEAATAATASATRLGLKSARVVRSGTYLVSARRRASDASISGKDDRTRAARGPPADVRRSSASARDCERLQDIVRDDRSGRTPGALGDEALASASPGRSESPGTAPADVRSSSAASVSRARAGTRAHRPEGGPRSLGDTPGSSWKPERGRLRSPKTRTFAVMAVQGPHPCCRCGM
jgi:hypothetical protein